MAQATISNLLQNKGHQRLWLMLSLLWIVGAGWYFWTALPEYQPVDGSQLASSYCDGLVQGDEQKAQTDAYERCIADWKTDPNSHAEMTNHGFTAESVCSMKRIIPDIAQRDRAVSACFQSQSATMARKFQPQADRETDQARIDQILKWLSVTVLPPILIPLGIIIFMLMQGYVSAGYRR